MSTLCLKTLHLLPLFYSDNQIITVWSRPAICTLIGWVKSSRLFKSLSGFCWFNLPIYLQVCYVRQWINDDTNFPGRQNLFDINYFLMDPFMLLKYGMWSNNKTYFDKNCFDSIQFWQLFLCCIYQSIVKKIHIELNSIAILFHPCRLIRYNCS